MTHTTCNTHTVCHHEPECPWPRRLCDNSSCIPCRHKREPTGTEPAPPARQEHHAVLVAYLKTKVEAADWHAVSDAANDLRVLEAQIAAEPAPQQSRGTPVRQTVTGQRF